MKKTCHHTSFCQHKIVIAGNHELSFDPSTIEEARDYMRQAGEERNMDKVVTNILNVYLII